MSATKWVLCPICNQKTRIKVREDTILENFPLYCPKCHRETLIAVHAAHTGNVSGLLVYAKTQEAITPNCLFNLGGNQIGARTLDLNQDFRQITAQLDGIAQQFFGKHPL